MHLYSKYLLSMSILLQIFTKMSPVTSLNYLQNYRCRFFKEPKPILLYVLVLYRIEAYTGIGFNYFRIEAYSCVKIFKNATKL